MSAMSRRKGAGFEREIVNLLKAAGHDCARNLDQVRDGGGDIRLGDWLIECKRRKTVAIYEWWDQVVNAVKSYKQPWDNNYGLLKEKPKAPALIIRADKRESLAVIRLSDFIELISPTKTGRDLL